MRPGLPAGIEQVVETGARLVAGGVVEDEPAANATAERLQVGCAQAFGGALVTGQYHAKELAGVEILGGEHTQFVEDGGEVLLCFVDNQHRLNQCLRDVVAPAGARDLKGGPPIVGGERDGKEVSKLAIEIAGAALRARVLPVLRLQCQTHGCRSGQVGPRVAQHCGVTRRRHPSRAQHNLIRRTTSSTLAGGLAAE